MANKIHNPIIPGFYPDPSICRVGEDYYVTCSSFELYPGLPVFHSKDLANWEQICYAMTMENGFHVNANIYAGGVMAPTIRYYKGMYYIINCNFADKGNFIVKAEDPAGPWSAPYDLTDVPGIDASFFFDDENEKVYMIGTGDVVKRADGTMDRGIWICEFDIENMKCIGEPKAIWDSALRVATSPEAPHIYKRGEYYYLVIAEGGTEHYHSVAVARSKDLFGWYEGNPANPVMTHRHFGFYHPIDNVGHADLVETQDGNWYAVLLASRIIEGQHKNLGRETYLCPVIWERDWPIFSPGSGKIEFEYPADEFLPWTPVQKEIQRDDFESEKLNMVWSFWGTPYQEFWRVEDSCLKLKCMPRRMCEPLKSFMEADTANRENCVSFVGRRQRDIDFTVRTSLKFQPNQLEAAGIVVMQASNYQYRLECAVEDGVQVLRLILATTEQHGLPYIPGFSATTTEEILCSVPYHKEQVILGLNVKSQEYRFLYGENEEQLIPMGEPVSGKTINPEQIGGMVGTVIGMFASANGTPSENWAKFDYFEYKGM